MGNLQTTPEEAIKAAAKEGHTYPPISYIGDETSVAKVKQGASTLNNTELADKIRGVIYGNALGDAMGLATEFMNKAEAKHHYGACSPLIPFDKFVRDSHRARWPLGDWTDDTDQMLLILDGLLRNNGKVEVLDFASRLYFWHLHGYAEVGDLAGLGIGQTVMKVVSNEDFPTDPHKVSELIFKRSGGWGAANGAVMRTSILGTVCFEDMAKVIANTEAIAKCTHWDPRCIASCVMATTAIAQLLAGRTYNPKNSKTINVLIHTSLTHAKQYLQAMPDALQDFEKHISVDSLEKLALDDLEKIGYTFKCIGAGVYALRYGEDFVSTIHEILMQAGDADTNCAVAGALLGAKLGFKALPQDLLAQMPNKAWLDARVRRFLSLLGLE